MTNAQPVANTIQSVGDEGFVLHCPICDFNYSHHGQVEVFHRVLGEDSATVVLLPGRGEAIPASTFNGGTPNPSTRRDAVRVHFDGECGHKWTLDIIQTKGQTFLSVQPA